MGFKRFRLCILSSEGGGVRFDNSLDLVHKEEKLLSARGWVGVSLAALCKRDELAWDKEGVELENDDCEGDGSRRKDISSNGPPAAEVADERDDLLDVELAVLFTPSKLFGLNALPDALVEVVPDCLHVRFTPVDQLWLAVAVAGHGVEKAEEEGDEVRHEGAVRVHEMSVHAQRFCLFA
jgi:hypothetical protein